MNFEELTVRITPGPHQRLRLEASCRFGSETVEVDWPAGWGPERPPPAEPVATSAAAARQLGEAWFRCLFPPLLLGLWQRSLDALVEGQVLRLRIAQSPTEAACAVLLEAPWENLCEPGLGGGFLALRREVSVVRELAGVQVVDVVPAHPAPVRVLAFSACPEGFRAPEAAGDWRGLEAACGDRHRMCQGRLGAPTREALFGALAARPVHGLHFAGYGFFDPSKGLGQLMLERLTGEPDFVGADPLGEVFRYTPPPRFALLNLSAGGRGLGLTRGATAAGVAAALHHAGVPVVVAWRTPVSERAAEVFTENFYHQLVAGASVDTATTHARGVVRAAVPEGSAWTSPMLFSRLPDGQVFGPGVEQPVVASAQPFHPLQPFHPPVGFWQLDAP